MTDLYTRDITTQQTGQLNQKLRFYVGHILTFFLYILPFELSQRLCFSHKDNY